MTNYLKTSLFSLASFAVGSEDMHKCCRKPLIDDSTPNGNGHCLISHQIREFRHITHKNRDSFFPMVCKVSPGKCCHTACLRLERIVREIRIWISKTRSVFNGQGYFLLNPHVPISYPPLTLPLWIADQIPQQGVGTPREYTWQRSNDLMMIEAGKSIWRNYVL